MPLEETHVVTAFLRNRGEVLLVRRSDAVGTYPGLWGGVSGFAEGDPDAAADEEVAEETGLLDAATRVRAGEPVDVEDESLSRRWVVHPYLYDCESRDVAPNEELAETEWTTPTAILDRETVPGLWAAYERVAPTVASIAADGEHGSAYLSVRALEVLRDRAGLLAADGDGSEDGDEEATDAGDADDWDELADLARRLRRVRPGMSALHNRVNRVMAAAAEGKAAAVEEDDGTAAPENRTAAPERRTAAAVEAAAVAGVDRAVAADEAAAAATADLVAGGTVLTLSRSGTVLAALRAADPPPAVLVAESRPAREGVWVAEELSTDLAVTLLADAAVAHVLADRDVDLVVVGADTVLPDGGVVNKVGTRGAALAAAREDVALYAAAATDKVTTEPSVPLEFGEGTAVYDGDAPVDATNPLFDVTPPDLVAGVVTEEGVLSADEVAAVADEHRTAAEWG